jgi:hypothetical protein
VLGGGAEGASAVFSRRRRVSWGRPSASSRAAAGEVGDDRRADEDVEGQLVDRGTPGQEMGRRVDVGAGVRAQRQPRDSGDVAGLDPGHRLHQHRRITRPHRHAGVDRK